MATVFLARAEGLGGFERYVAVKLIHAHLRENSELALSLLDEARIAARIRHPNVVPVYDVGEDPAGIFLVMEYVEGDTLSGVQRAARSLNQALPTAVGLRILTDALAGLQSAHEQRHADGSSLEIVHRDFSPQNILVGTDGVSRLTDFGIAKAAGRSGHTSPGAIKGKVGYMAPEQARGKALDQRCDVWAAGVIAWELLAGRPLHDNNDEVATLLDVVTRAPPNLRSIDPTIPESLAQAVAWALNPDRQRRCPTAEELRRRLIDGWRNHGSLADASQVAAYLASVGGGRTLTPLPREAQAMPARSDSVTPVLDQPPCAPGPRGATVTLQSVVARAANDAGPLPAMPGLPGLPARPRPGRRIAAVAAIIFTLGTGGMAIHRARQPRAAIAAALPAAPPAMATGPASAAANHNLVPAVTRTGASSALFDMAQSPRSPTTAGSASLVTAVRAVRPQHRLHAHLARHPAGRKSATATTRSPETPAGSSRLAAVVSATRSAAARSAASAPASAASATPPPLAGNPYAGARP